MKWPLVWRSTMERAVEQAARDAQRDIKSYSDSREQRLADEQAAHWVTNQGLRQVRATLSGIQAEAKAAAAAHEAALRDLRQANIRADIRAEEWQAIAHELIAAGAGRPTLPSPARTESAIAKKIREEAAGDPQIAAHFWKNVVAPAKAAGKSDEEIVGLIGWETTDPEPAV